MSIKKGENCIISKDAVIGNNVALGHGCIVEEGAVIGENSFIDSGSIIRSGCTVGSDSFIASGCIIGEYQMDFILDRKKHLHPLTIGNGAIIRSGSIIYAGSCIGDSFQTGHKVSIRENAKIGDHVSIGTLCDVQGNCEIGNYVRLHSNVFVAPLSKIDDFVWIFPCVVFTNDPTPPSENFVGAHVCSFAIVAAGAVILPGIEIAGDSLVAAGAVVTKNVEKFAVVGGNPAKVISDVRKIKNKITGEPVYPWRNHFDRAMPWKDKGFESWFSSLSDAEAEHYGLSSFEC